MNLVEHLQTLSVRSELMPLQGQQAMVRYREAGGALSSQVPLVLLHGIGSGSASWVYQLDTADAISDAMVLAWDAPGYADSTPLAAQHPIATDYAYALWDWLDTLGIDKVRIAGHSLGCIIAARAARQQCGRVQALTLISPSQGYGTLPESERTRKTRLRIARSLHMHDADNAHSRALELLGENPNPEHLGLMVSMLQALHVNGYAQASHMRAHADLAADLHALRSMASTQVTVVCGALDTLTPPNECRALARSVGAHYVQLSGAHHMCALQASTEVNVLLGITDEDSD